MVPFLVANQVRVSSTPSLSLRLSLSLSLSLSPTLLVANQIMFLAGLTSAICVAPARWYIYGLAVATGPSRFQPHTQPQPHHHLDPHHGVMTNAFKQLL